MEILEDAKRFNIAVRVAAVLIAALGLYIALAIIPPAWRIVTGDKPLSHIFFLAVVAIPAFILKFRKCPIPAEALHLEDTVCSLRTRHGQAAIL